MAWLPIAAASFLCLLLSSSPARAGDPYLRWYTLHTPHFRIHYHGGLEEIAQRVANLAEAARERLRGDLGFTPSEVTEVLLTDTSDSANGSASVKPYDAIRLFVTAPDDMSALGDYDDWLSLLITHEDTHILHVDNVSGVPGVLNAIFGKTYAPNQTNPRWLLEGLATVMESRYSSGGRLRSSLFDMYLRADVLENNFAPLDQISHAIRRWPSGNIPYLYGSRFIEWIYDLYGPDTFAAVAYDYGSQIIRFGINRSLQRATGSTYVELYPIWHAHLLKKYGAQRARVQARGLREGKRITHHGRGAAYPRFIPACAKLGFSHEILYYRDDGHSTPGFYRIALDANADPLSDRTELVTRSNGQTASFDAECGFVFDEAASTRRRYRFYDLFRQPPKTRSPRGIEKNRQRLTAGRRARDPDVSPDGRRVVYVTNRDGTGTLRIADLDPQHRVSNERALVPSARFEQAFTPRFSPDGRRVAYSAWTKHGYRDIRVVDVESGRFIELSHDRATDQQPSFSPDGRYVYFTSDRTGIANVYAYDLEQKRLHQVTNVVNGAYMPNISFDGTLLAYAGYTSDGFDLYVMRLDRSRWLDAPPGPAARPAPLPDPPLTRWPIESYNPFTTLRPRAYELEYGTGTFGQALTVRTSGSDIVGHHSFALALTVETEQGDPQASIDYAFRRLPFDLRVTAFRSAAPRTSYRFSDETPTLVEHTTGITTGISYGIVDTFEFQQAALSYTMARFDQRLPVGAAIDPYALTTRDPHRGYLGLVRVGYGYSNAERSAYGISAEKGMSVALGVDYASHFTGGDSTLTSVTARATKYLELPWARHHVLALAASGGTSTGNFPRRGLFFTGGFADQSTFDIFTTGIRQGSFVLRGYEPQQFIGSQFNLVNAEYRFPIAYPERGVSTLPFMVRTISGAAFADFGGAFDRLDLDDPLASYHLGIGAELWLDVVLGYFVDNTLRIGAAHGLDDEAPGLQVYFAAVAEF